MTVFPKREDVLRRQTPPLGRGRGREPAGSGDARRQDAARQGRPGLSIAGRRCQTLLASLPAPAPAGQVLAGAARRPPQVWPSVPARPPPTERPL